MYNEDEDQEPEDKFDDCKDCKNKFKPWVCRWCGCGEEFEPEDIEEVDAHFNGRI